MPVGPAGGISEFNPTTAGVTVNHNHLQRSLRLGTGERLGLGTSRPSESKTAGVTTDFTVLVDSDDLPA